VQVRALSWNLFHGRDFPPDPALFTWRSRLLRVTERNATHVQVNRDLFAEFARVLAGTEWDVALLQECPPRWWEPLAAACEAEAHGVLTSRNSFGALRSVAARLNPDLIASAEGGSNLTLVRNRFRWAFPTQEVGKAHRKQGIVNRHELTIHEGRPERRAMALTRVGVPSRDGTEGGRAELCLANLHATADRPQLAGEDVLRAAEAATEWAGDAPLIFGGDLNLRPASEPAIFDELRERFGLTGPTAPGAIDHLLTRGLEIVEAPRVWPPERRELHEEMRARFAAQSDPSGNCNRDLALRLSDHTPIEASFSTPASR
jgi:endonuclease/exonuclease/phosphatase family metal-dependent hydrolase